MKKEDLKLSIDHIKPEESAEKSMLKNVLFYYDNRKESCFMKRFNYKKAVPALALAVILAGSMLAYDMLADKSSRPPKERDSAGDSFDEREDMAAPLLNQFQMDGRHYILLSDDLRQEYGLPAEIADEDVSSRMTTITTSVDPSLIGSEVYQYKPAGGEAIVAVKKDNAYQLFRFFTFESYNNNQDEDAASYLKLYGIEKAEDIGKVQFIAHSEQSKLEGRIDVRGEITGSGEIAQFYSHYSALKNAADKYFDRLFSYMPADNGMKSVETDIAATDPAIPPDAPDAPDKAVQQQDGTASKDQSVSSNSGQSGIMDKGDTGSGAGSSGSGSTEPSQGSAGNALSDMITVRIFNQSGIYYDTPYYRNIQFLSRYEVSEPFAEFMKNYID